MGPPIFVCFTADSSPLSRFIRWVTGGDVSHVLLAHPSPNWGTWLGIAATDAGWTYRALSIDLPSIVAVYELEGVDIWAGLQKFAGWLGAGYDFAGLAGESDVELQRRLLHRSALSNPLASKQRVFCSEIVARVLRASSVPILPTDPDSTIDPSMLRTAIERLTMARPITPEAFQARIASGVDLLRVA